MATTIDPKPGLDEQYIMATNATDLTVHPDRTTAADHLIAAGLVGNRMGSILIHLVGEWSSANKPPKLGDAEVVALAEQLPRLNAKGKLDMKRARAVAQDKRNRALREAYFSLPSRAGALAVMSEWAQRRNIDPDILSTSLYSYLAPACPVCDGRGAMRLPDAPGLGKRCHACNGQREPGQSDGPTILPRTEGTQRIHDWLKSCAGKARAQRGCLMYGKAEVTPMADRLRGPVEVEQSAKAAQAVADVARASMERRNPQ